MAEYRIAVCDDEPQWEKKIAQETEDICRGQGLTVQLERYAGSAWLAADMEEGKSWDILICDIEMPKVSGMDLARLAKERNPAMLLIFVTGYRRYAVDAYEYEVFRYVLKEEQWQERLRRALRDAFSFLSVENDRYYVIRTAKNLVKIPFADILYLKKEGKNVVWHRRDGSCIPERKSLADACRSLETPADAGNAGSFCYIDRGLIVNLAHVRGIEDGQVVLEGGLRFCAAADRLEPFRKALLGFWEAYV